MNNTTTKTAGEAYVFTEEDKVLLAQLKEGLDLENTVGITTFGSDVQKMMAELSQMVLSNLSQADTVGLGDLLNHTMEYLGGIEQEEKRKPGLFHTKTAKGLLLQSKYDEVLSNVEKIEKVLADHHMKLLMNSALLDRLYQLNREYFRLLKIRAEVIRQTIADVQNDSHPVIAKHAADGGWKKAVLLRLEHKLEELELTAAVATQQAPQLLMLQSNITSMASGVQSTLYNVIPLWKNTVTAAIGMEQTKEQTKKLETNQMLMESLEAFRKISADSEAKKNSAEEALSKMDAAIRENMK
ncbi:MAG: toxic anion resistance protein [Acetatifactor sp.]|nr:toxic anion resistance protein [Acetatifactor sp.]